MNSKYVTFGIGFIIVFALVLALIYLWIQVDYLEIESKHKYITANNSDVQNTVAGNNYNKAKNKIEVTGESWNNTSESEINFYKEMTDKVISRADFVITLIGAILAGFTLLTMFFAALNYQISADLRSKLDSAAKLEDKVFKLSETQHELESEVNELKVMQHWVKGIVYMQNEKLVPAVKEFQKAEMIGNNDRVKLQLATVHSDLLSKKIKENRFSEHDFKEAERYLLEALKINNDEITCEESLLTLACLYGVVGKYYKKEKEIEKSIDYFEKSKEYFDKARRKNNNNPDIYKNSAITHLYLEDIAIMKEALINAKNCMQLDERYKLEKRTILSAFEKDDKRFAKKLMGKDKWNELKNKFG